MKQLHHQAGSDVPARGRWTGRRAMGALMALAAVALVAAILLGAPLVSIFIVGLLLLCPLLMWGAVPPRGTRIGPAGSVGRQPRP